ncbi:MAG: hypothetical protein IH626_17640 [Rhodospirillales bacterium]|nr:hypothetical protein [Rhodospirillales bacterium]
MAADSQACENADRQPSVYIACTRAKGYRQANHEDVGPAGALVYRWVDLRRNNAKAYDDLTACQSSAPQETIARTLAVETCMTQRGYLLWTGGEVDDYERLAGGARDVYGACMIDVDRKLPLSQVRPSELDGRRQLRDACMSGLGYAGGQRPHL